MIIKSERADVLKNTEADLSAKLLFTRTTESPCCLSCCCWNKLANIYNTDIRNQKKKREKISQDNFFLNISKHLHKSEDNDNIRPRPAFQTCNYIQINPGVCVRVKKNARANK